VSVQPAEPIDCTSSAQESSVVTRLRIFSVLDLPVLAPMLADAGMKLVDLGGRGEAFLAVAPLVRFADYYVCEPDPIEAQRLKEQLPREFPWRSLTVLSEAIASRRGEAVLHVTSSPGMSSLLEPDPGVTGHFFLSSRFQIVGTTTVPTLPLDEAASRYGFTDACFLKIDTQGTELEILQSGPRLVRESLLGVYVECSFRPFYRGQALFSDVDSHLRESGFALFSLSRTNLRRAGYRQSLYSRRVASWAHCLYLREPETLLSAGTSARLQLPRLLGLALAFEQYDLAFEIVAMAGRVGLLDEHAWQQLAEDVESCVSFATHRLVRAAKKNGRVDDLMSSSFRDKKQIE
jgi:FkbM family methyltransferase